MEVDEVGGVTDQFAEQRLGTVVVPEPEEGGKSELHGKDLDHPQVRPLIDLHLAEGVVEAVEVGLPAEALTEPEVLLREVEAFQLLPQGPAAEALIMQE